MACIIQLMQSKKIYKLALQVQNCFFRSISVIILNEILLISARGTEGALYKLSRWDPGRNPRNQSNFRFYIVSHPSKTVKNPSKTVKNYLVDQFVVHFLITKFRKCM